MGTRAFFESLEAQADPARLHGTEVAYRFVIDGAGTWHVAIRDGSITVTENGDAPVDATIRTSAAVFDRIVAREQLQEGHVQERITGKVGRIRERAILRGQRLGHRHARAGERLRRD